MSGKKEPAWKFNEDLKSSGTYPWKYGIESKDWISTDRFEFKYWATLYDAALKTDFNNKNEVMRFQHAANSALETLHKYNTNHGLHWLDVDGIPGKQTMNFVQKVNNQMDAYRVAYPRDAIKTEED